MQNLKLLRNRRLFQNRSFSDYDSEGPSIVSLAKTSRLQLTNILCKQPSPFRLRTNEIVTTRVTCARSHRISLEQHLRTTANTCRALLKYALHRSNGNINCSRISSDVKLERCNMLAVVNSLSMCRHRASVIYFSDNDSLIRPLISY